MPTPTKRPRRSRASRLPPQPDREVTAAEVVELLGLKNRQRVQLRAKTHPTRFRTRLWHPDPPISGSARGILVCNLADVLVWSYERGRTHPQRGT